MNRNATTRCGVMVLFVSLIAVAGPVAWGACVDDWLPGERLPGVDGWVYAMTPWDPDGPGPAAPRVAIGGSFTAAGDVIANNIAAYDVATDTWFAFGTGTDGAVRALTALPNGDLVVGGEFSSAGGVTVNRIARWDGSGWAALDTGLSGMPGGGYYGDAVVNAALTLPSGDVVVAGRFWHAGGVGAANNIARWNGLAWSALGGGMVGETRALAQRPNGDILVTGGGDILAWNGLSWVLIGTPSGGGVTGLAVPANGDVVAVGSFTSIGGVQANRIARWDGAWHPLGAGTDALIRSVTVLAAGDIVVSGEFTTAGGAPAEHIARWDGSTWEPLGTGTSLPAYALAPLPDGGLMAGGYFEQAGDTPAKKVARWSGNGWSSLGCGFNARVRAVLAHDDELFVGGDFTTTGDCQSSYVTRWDGSGWSPLGSGTSAEVTSLATLNYQSIVAGGWFTQAGDAPAYRVARWDGTNWSSVGSQDSAWAGVGGQVSAVAVLASGDLVAGGWFTTTDSGVAYRIARWDGTVWSGMNLGLNSIVSALLPLPDGDLIAGGEFVGAYLPNEATRAITLARHVARWNGTSWAALGTGLGVSPHTSDGETVCALVRLSNGDLVAGGLFASTGVMIVNNIARWNGTSWVPLGTGTNWAVRALAVLPNGDMVAGGEFTEIDGISANYIARWDGTSWHPMGAGTNGAVRALQVLPDGQLVVGGDFTTAGEHVSAYLARWGCAAPLACAGDMDCDGVVSFADIDPFVLALGGETAYLAHYPDCLWLNGDINGDHAITFADIDPFVARLGASCP